jgi:acyl-CoA synthetase (NDP forming)
MGRHKLCELSISARCKSYFLYACATTPGTQDLRQVVCERVRKESHTSFYAKALTTMERASQVIAKVRKEGRKFLLEPEAKEVCMMYGIPVTRFKVAKAVGEAVKFADEIGYPVVLKIVSPDIVHKSDAGGVILNLKTPDETRDAYKEILANAKKHQPDAKIAGVFVQEMAPSSTEVIVGATKDPQFGPALMFGLGGIFVEILEDVTFRIAPLTEREAREMITEIKAYPVLEGYRGRPRADVEALVEILLNTSRLVMDHPEIKELDLNPIMVYEKGATTVDARIILE